MNIETICTITNQPCCFCQPNCSYRIYKKLPLSFVYVITTFINFETNDNNEIEHINGQRTPAIFTKYEDALNALFHNVMDLYEYIYDYAVLETLPVGFYPTIYKEYRCEYFKFNADKKGYERISALKFPPCKLSIWSIG